MGPFTTNLLKLSGIQPVTAAARAEVHIDLPFGAKEMALELDAIATRTGTLDGQIHSDRGIALDVQEPLVGDLLLIIHLLELKCIEPDAPATTLANIHVHAAQFGLSQF